VAIEIAVYAALTWRLVQRFRALDMLPPNLHRAKEYGTAAQAAAAVFDSHPIGEIEIIGAGIRFGRKIVPLELFSPICLTIKSHCRLRMPSPTFPASNATGCDRSGLPPRSVRHETG
jgi:hypothetical protein